METLFTFTSIYTYIYGNTIYIYLQDIYWITEIENYLQLFIELQNIYGIKVLIKIYIYYIHLVTIRLYIDIYTYIYGNTIYIYIYIYGNTIYIYLQDKYIELHLFTKYIELQE